MSDKKPPPSPEKLPDALSRISRAIDTAGLNPGEILYNEALTMAKEGLFAVAQLRLQILLALDPDDVEAHGLLVIIYEQQKEWHLAQRELDLYRDRGGQATEILSKQEAITAGLRDALYLAGDHARVLDEQARTIRRLRGKLSEFHTQQNASEEPSGYKKVSLPIACPSDWAQVKQGNEFQALSKWLGVLTPEFVNSTPDMTLWLEQIMTNLLRLLKTVSFDNPAEENRWKVFLHSQLNEIFELMGTRKALWMAGVTEVAKALPFGNSPVTVTGNQLSYLKNPPANMQRLGAQESTFFTWLGEMVDSIEEKKGLATPLSQDLEIALMNVITPLLEARRIATVNMFNPEDVKAREWATFFDDLLVRIYDLLRK